MIETLDDPLLALFSEWQSLDIYRTANELVKQHGLKGASDYAADRIQRLMDFQDHDGVAVWRQIRAALLDLGDIEFNDDPVN